MLMTWHSYQEEEEEEEEEEGVVVEFDEMASKTVTAVLGRI